MFRKQLICCLALALGACSGSVAPSGGESGQGLTKLPASSNPYTLFETLQVRPMALSPSGKLLFVANTPDNRLETFAVTSKGLLPIGSVSVGLEPIALAARSDGEVWVVNHLSDSVSIVAVNGGFAPTVTRTLLVGDEPRDIVFAGPRHNMAFITTAHRGQNTGDAYDQQTPGVGRADVWVFDALNLGTNAGGSRVAKLTFFADYPRALAASADGSRVYAAAFNSGNQTTVASSYAVSKVNNGVMPGPATINLFGQVIPMPPTGLVVKYKNGHWFDAYGSAYDPFIKVNLPDLDVFTIDATQNPPVAVANGAFAHVGTTLFNMAVNPANGKVYVTNTEAHNDVRFEGHNAGFSTVRGHESDQRITVIDPGAGSVAPVDLNPHVDYTQDGNPAEKALSVAFPQDIAVSHDGSTLYTVAQGSSKLAIYKTADLEAGSVTPSLANQVVLSGGGPTGVALDEVNHRAYVLTRFDNSVKIVDLTTNTEVGKVAMFNPEPASVTNGRKYLYDANLTSQHGTSACASCHIGGDKDELAWDLGNPGFFPLTITHSSPAGDTGHLNIFTIDPNSIIALLPVFKPIFDYNMPVKGPMTTQSLRGMDNHGAMHWRGDRNGAINQDGTPVIDPATGAPVVSAQPNSGIYDEVRAFTSFNVAFPGLVGNDQMLSPSDMLDFATFMLQATYPPNPNRNLDDSLTPIQQAGHDFYFNSVSVNGQNIPLPSDRFHNCVGCHALDPNGNLGSTAHPGFFGTDGHLSFEFESQIFKVPHLRNMYTKVGMFRSSPDSLQPGTIVLQTDPATGQLFPPTDQIRGFGYQHDGVLGSLEDFFTGLVFLRMDTDVFVSSPSSPGGIADVGPNPYGIPFVDPNQLAQGKVVWVAEKDGSDPGGFNKRYAIVNFLMAFDSNMKPSVGQQITMDQVNGATSGPRLDLLESVAVKGHCDLVGKSASLLGAQSGLLYTNGAWQPASTRVGGIPDATLRGWIATGKIPPVTFTCVPPGSGARIALDRDGDGYADFDEIAAGTNPSNPNSHP